MNHNLHLISESSRRANSTNNPEIPSVTPPPPYVPLPPAGIVTGDNHPHLQAQLPVAPGLQPHVPIQQQAFGPTPISTSLPLLPYAFYESSGAAAARARWRFVSAVIIALGIYIFAAAVVGLGLLGEMAGS